MSALQILFLVFALGALGGVGCGEPSAPATHPPEPSAASGPEDAAWLVVDPEAVQEEPGLHIFWQGPTRPRPLQKPPVQLDAPPRRIPKGVWIVHVAISEKGRVLKAKLLKGPSDLSIQGPLVEALKSWRFEPARYRGETVAVYVTETFEIVGTR